jgi:MFS transporter, AAHS family, 4-hydroxybenzoate transporter
MYISSLSATLITPAEEKVGHDFNITPFFSNLPYGLYILGLAIGSIAGLAVSEAFSRRYGILLSLLSFGLLQLGVGLSNDVILLYCLRFFAGFFGGMSSLVSSSVLFDMFPRNKRTLGYIVFFGALLLGPVVG